MGQVVFEFDALPSAPLLVDAIYKAGSQPNFGGEPLPRLMPRIGNQGGFRPANLDKITLTCSFVVIFSSGRELE